MQSVIFIIHITMTSWWARRRLKSPASRLFAKPFVEVQIKENIKAPGGFPAQMASNAENVSIWWRHHELIVAEGRIYVIRLGHH